MRGNCQSSTKTLTVAKSTRSGYTLIELLVVITVAGILAVLILGGVDTAVRSAKAAKCLSNLRSYGNALNLYMAEHGGLPYWDGGRQADQKPETGSSYPNFEGWTRPYLHEKKERRLRCPLAKASDSEQRFNYGGNSALCIYFPKLGSLTKYATRSVLAAECYSYEGINNSVHLNMTMWGVGESDAYGNLEDFEKAEAKNRLQYHGSRKNPALNLFFVDGHVAPIAPTDADWRKSPTYGDATNGGYFYDKKQFAKIKAGTL